MEFKTLKYVIQYIIIGIALWELLIFINYSNGYLDRDSPFVCVETTSTNRIVYHKETKVMYTVSTSRFNRGVYTVLVDEDGTVHLIPIDILFLSYKNGGILNE